MLSLRRLFCVKVKRNLVTLLQEIFIMETTCVSTIVCFCLQLKMREI